MSQIEWSGIERKMACTIAEWLEASPASRRTALEPRTITMSPDTARHLSNGIRTTRLVSPTNFVPVRHLYEVLGFDESRPFQWRLEHKLIHTLLLNHYAPGRVPRTCGLRRYITSQREAMPIRRLVDELKTAGYIKPALGSGSDPDNREEADIAIQSTLAEPRPTGTMALPDEHWIVQQRLSLVTEYRVHSVEDVVVPQLTCLRHSERPLRADREEPNAFVSSVLQMLPNAFVHQSLCGWDIGRAADGKLYVLEVNWGGFHPFGEVGFQCSGYLAQDAWGPYRIAKLIQFLEGQYGVQIVVEAPPHAGADVLSGLYMSIHRWLTLLRLAGLARVLSSAMSGAGCSAGDQETTEQRRAYRVLQRMLASRVSTIGEVVE